MESPVNTTGGTTEDQGGVPQAIIKNARATKAEMEARQQDVLNFLLSNKSGDIYEVAKALKLTNPQVLTLIQNLINSGKIRKSGRDGRRIVYKVVTPSKKKAHVAVDVDSEPISKSIPKVESLPVQMGEKLEVVAIHITEAGVKVELKDDNSKTLTLVA